MRRQRVIKRNRKSSTCSELQVPLTRDAQNPSEGLPQHPFSNLKPNGVQSAAESCSLSTAGNQLLRLTEAEISEADHFLFRTTWRGNRTQIVIRIKITEISEIRS